MKHTMKHSLAMAFATTLLFASASLAAEGNNGLNTGNTAYCQYRTKSCENVRWGTPQRENNVRLCIVSAIRSGMDDNTASIRCNAAYPTDVCTFEVHTDYVSCPDTVERFRFDTKSLEDCRNTCRRSLSGDPRIVPIDGGWPWHNGDVVGEIILF